MKRLKRWLLLLGTLLLIGAGAGMPWAAARVQDRYGIASQEVLPLDEVSLTLRKESEIGSVLRLVADPYDYTDWPSETGMTGEEICAAALDALGELDRHGLLESGWLGDYYGYIEPGIPARLKAGGTAAAAPQLLIGADGTTAVVWWCTWEGNACPAYTFLVDDATGLILSGYLPCRTEEKGDAEEPYRRMERWLNFFQDYYGIEIYGFADNAYDAAHEFIFGFDPEDGLGMCGLSVGLYSNEMDFAPSPVNGLLAVLPEDDAPAEKNHAAAG